MKAKQRQPFLYADKGEQVKRINLSLIVVYSIFYVFFSSVMMTARWVEQRPDSQVFAFIGFCVAALGLDIMIYIKKKDSEWLRVAAYIGLFVIALWSGIVFSGAHLKIMTVVPLVLCIFYYDSRFTVMTSVTMMVLYQGLTVVQGFVLTSISQENMMAEFCTSLALILILAVIMIAERVGKQFNEDALGRVESEKKQQKEMLDEIIAVAAEIRSETQKAMEVVGGLSDSTGVVASAMGDIYQSTQSTAESIETQTTMTQNIQSAIEQTLRYSENMVEIAKASMARNTNNMEQMEQLMNSSGTISILNSDVAQTMEQLLERTEAVRGISDTILSISSQTNLLALNASIESARAGEAGRGFAVVADEIRQLAEKTRMETENIASVLQELSENAQGAVHAVAKSTEATKVEKELIGAVSTSFEEMNAGVEGLTENITQVDEMLMALSASNNQIVDNITQLSATTEEVTASSMEAENLSARNLADADNMRDMLGEILHVSAKFDKYMTGENE